MSTTLSPPSVKTERVVVSRGGSRLHLPYPEDGAAPRCGSGDDTRTKPLAAFPPAHREWCRRRVRLVEET
ncbi:hypothetical protein [Haloglomus halophilum]|uniref:hypothetical protein n=1 Tax=Haloglomus halophilum TaxID=2962672 RepID=UPI0020C99885|nr:hypothetical protein [Haloglomus halophilum]